MAQAEFSNLYRGLWDDLFDQPSVNEVYLNGDGSLWVDDVGKGVYCACSAVDPQKTNQFWEVLSKIYPDNPLIIEGELPFRNARIECLKSPLFEGVSPIIFAIRKQANHIFSLQSYKQSGIIAPIKGIMRGKTEIIGSIKENYRHPIDAIIEAVKNKKNILIAGGTGSGKTTLSNAILAEIAVNTPNDRVITIEDTLELQLDVANKLALRSSKQASIKDLLRCCMRLHPDRIIVGEVRGAEAYSLLKAWNSGHPGGVATLHANSAAEALEKLSHYIYEDEVARAFNQDSVGWMIAHSVDLVVVIEHSNQHETKRKVTEICEVKGYMNGRYNLSVLLQQSVTGLCEFKPLI